MAYEITALIRAAVDAKASDIHLYVDQRPAFRVDGLITLIEGPRLEAGDIQRFAQEIVPTDGWERIQAEKEIDFAIPLSQEDSDTSSIRLRANVFYSKGNFGIVLRIVRSDIMAIEDIGFHNVEVIKRLVSSPRGLILVTGPTGSGKSTTLAAMIDWINSTEEKHIVTIEDPIEYIHPHKKCLISQRELGKDTPSFSRAIVGGMRQDPDIILVGEMRDLATVEAAVSAAETGHLVLSTLHTTGSARTVDRIIDIFPESGKELVRMQLASNLVAVISQVLCRNINGMGRTAAFEIMVRSDSISNLIREKKTFRIQTELETGSNVGMIPLDKSLIQLYQRGTISAQEALSKAQNPAEMAATIRSSPVSRKKKGWL